MEPQGLVDVSKHAWAIGFLVPVAMTRRAWEELVEIRYDLPLMQRNPRMRERRLIDVLLQALRLARVQGKKSSAQFSTYRLTGREERRSTGRVAIKNEVLVSCGPNDYGNPIITISLADEH